MPWLTTEGTSHQIADGETVVGSGPEAGWRLQSRDLDPKHFLIVRRGSEVTVRPCGIEGVIVINGAQSGAQAAGLHDGDTIDAGSARFLFSSERSGAYSPVLVPEAYLLELTGGVTHPLALQTVGIGRDKVNTIVVRDPTASRFHAEIRREAGGYVLHPHGSSGTLINGRGAGSPARLQDGDKIEIANVEFRFMVGPPPAGALRAEPGPNDEASQRRTVMQTAVMEIPREEKSPSNRWIWVVAVIVIAATLFLAMR